MSDIDFNQLATKAYREGAVKSDLDALWKELFSLTQWYFIMQGEKDKPYPQIGKMQDKKVIFAFTDTEKLYRAANTIGMRGEVSVLAIPLEGIIDYLELFGQYGVFGVWFNSADRGFYVPLKNLRVIYEMLKEEGLL